MKSYLFFLAIFSLLCVPASASEDSVARSRFDAFLADLESFTAAFEQTLFDEYGEVLEIASGRAAVAKPGRFRWAYESPYEQLIVSDGEHLWVYDIDLEQASMSKLDPNALDSPAAVLSGDVDIEARYTITDSATEDPTQAWLTLVPVASGAQYRAIDIGFDEQGLRGMKLRDNLGQLTVITFLEVRRNAEIPAAEFTFSPPAGVDVMTNSTLGAPAGE